MKKNKKNKDILTNKRESKHKSHETNKAKKFNFLFDNECEKKKLKDNKNILNCIFKDVLFSPKNKKKKILNLFFPFS